MTLFTAATASMARPLPSDDLYPAPPLQLNFGGSPLGVKITTGSATSIKQKVLLTTASITYTLRTTVCSLFIINFHLEWPSCWLAHADLGTDAIRSPGRWRQHGSHLRMAARRPVRSAAQHAHRSGGRDPAVRLSCCVPSQWHCRCLSFPGNCSRHKAVSLCG